MSPRVLLESSRGQFWENCRNRVRGRFWRNRQTFPRDVSGTPSKPDLATCPTSHRNPSAFVILMPSPSLSDLADVDASLPLVFPSYQQTPHRPTLAPGVDRNAAQQWPKHLGRPSPPHGRPVGPPTPPQGLPPPHGRRAPSHRNAAAWCIGTRLALVQTNSLPPRHPCTCTPQTKNWRNLHRVATTHS